MTKPASVSADLKKETLECIRLYARGCNACASLKEEGKDFSCSFAAKKEEKENFT